MENCKNLDCKNFPENRVAVCEVTLRSGEFFYAIPAVHLLDTKGNLEYWWSKGKKYHKDEVLTWREISTEELRAYQVNLPAGVVRY